LAALLETYPGPGLRRNVLLYKGDFTAAEKGLDPVLRRPLGVEWLRSQALAYDQIDEFLRGTDEEVAAAVGALYGRSGALNWFVMEDRELSGEARQKFVSYVVDSDHTALEMSSIAAAGASIKAYEIIGSLLPLLDDEWITRPQTLVNGSQGAIEGGSRLIIVLPALGYLGRVAHSAGEHAKAATVLDRLTSYRVKDGQEADEMARRTALAYLGLWKPLLQGLPERGTLWHKVAVNCVSYDWLPGPYTPRDEEGKEYIARWIAQELARPDSGYGPAVRSTLAEIKDGLEKELRQRIVVGYGPA
jgi:hypothetical protein